MNKNDYPKLQKMKLSELNPAPYNPRKISSDSLGRLTKSLSELGNLQPITYNAKTGNIVGGHQRLKCYSALGKDEVEVWAVWLDETQEKAANIALNKLSGEFDLPQLKDLIEEIDTGEIDLDITGFGEDELAELMEQTKPEVEEDEVPEVPVDAITKPGDLWILGKHRLLCGDSTKKEDVAKLTKGEKASLVITDPPYGVSYADKNKFLNEIDKGNKIQKQIENDHLSKEETQKMWKEAFARMNESMDAGAVVYCFMPQGGDQMMMMMMMMMMGAGIEPRHELIWLKNNHVLGRVDYAYKHEPILYAWKKGGHKFYGGFQTSVIECKRPNSSKLHPTMKPVELVAKLMENSSKAEEIIYEPFCGSGTTLIAAEQLGRKCYGMEISPNYCDVIVKRWENLTGKKATLEK